MTQTVTGAYLTSMLEDARVRTLELIEGLDSEQLIGPRLATVNPLQWEIGHVAWFYEQFILRRLYGFTPLLPRGDAIYDSIAVAHDTRWDLPLLPMDETLRYMARVHEALASRLDGGMASEQDSFIYQFATFHEDMHDEAFLWTRQTLSYPRPVLALVEASDPVPPAGDLPGDVEVPGGTFALGADPGAPFLFDNEKWSHPRPVAPFRIARAPVTNAAFAEFVEDHGYRRREFWDDEAWAWREETAAEHPVYWRFEGAARWLQRQFDLWRPLPPDQPVIHVNWHEARAWCRWAGRRLPTELEWEVAAGGEPDVREGILVHCKRRYPWGDTPPEPGRANLDGRTLGCVDVAALPEGDSAFGCRQMLGNVWEWTADTFAPYPGFAPDAYREYSQPLFGSTRVLRGGAWTTRGRMVNTTYRNYFGPERRDVFAGFRTCALWDSE